MKCCRNSIITVKFNQFILLRRWIVINTLKDGSFLKKKKEKKTGKKRKKKKKN